MKSTQSFVSANTKAYYQPVVKAISGRYGTYCVLNGINRGQKYMEENGFELKYITPEEASALMAAWENHNNELREAARKQKMQEREQQVNICLAAEPVVITVNEHYGNGRTPVTHVAGLSNTKMIDAYSGCGKGTAYVKDNKVVAFHYGYEKPDNAPKDAVAVHVELSCTEICFI